MNPDEQARRDLERLINDDLQHATVESACVTVLEDRRVVVDEITFRLADGRLMSVDVGDMSFEAGHMTTHNKALILETFVERDPARPWIREGWREADILMDYREELADALLAEDRA